IFPIVFLILFSGCGNHGQIIGIQDTQNIGADCNPPLQIIFFDIGQGDSILINTPQNKQLLIDGGPDQTVLEKLGKYLDFDDKYIDVVVLTHPHADHVDGLVDVLKRYKIGEVWITGVLHTSSKYLEFLDLLNEQNIFTKIIFICDEQTENSQTYPLGSIRTLNFNQRLPLFFCFLFSSTVNF
ncbi:MBL fold metallo-hydrolase, partial [Patescibacteria group bacterium]|nr:MBL fold metallo-hydrolase [Patescibacteria group bacterium]